MDEEEFLELKQETLEIFEEDVVDTLVYHEVQDPNDPNDPTPSTFNTRFGFVDEPATSEGAAVPTTLETELFFSNVYKARGKELSKALDEFEGEYDTKVYFSTQDLENKGVSISRERAFLRYKDGTELQIEAVQEIPKMFGSSIVTKLFCSKKKPVEDNAGIN